MIQHGDLACCCTPPWNAMAVVTCGDTVSYIPTRDNRDFEHRERWVLRCLLIRYVP